MGRRSFSGDYVKSELEKLATTASSKATLFVIGGLALINYGLKSATKDTDIVVTSKTELDTITSALNSIGYHPLDEYIISRPYKEMATARILENQDCFRWDIFLGQICNALTFTDTMKSRAKSFFKQNLLEAKLASKEDIFLFKGITDREADLDDMRRLAESELDWKIIAQECQMQSELSGRLWEGALLDSIANLRKTYKIRSPIEKSLEKIFEDKLSEDKLTKAISEGALTIQEIAQAANIPEQWVRDYANKMEQKGLLKIDKTKRPYKLTLTKPKQK